MRWSLLVLALAWMLLVPVPALSQPSSDAPSSAQYDQYPGPDHTGGGSVFGVGGQVVHDAIVASGAIRASAEEARATNEDAVTAAELPRATGGSDLASTGEMVSEDPTRIDEAQDGSSSDLEKLPEKLPDTGGPSPLWLGAPLLCAGGLLARRIML